MTSTPDAVVVGSGPNGLAAAIELARAGLSVTVFEAATTIGGGTRTEQLTIPGLLHDACSAIHPFGVASPMFTSLDLESHGLHWCYPTVDLAHLTDGGQAAVLVRSLAETCNGLEADGERWRKIFRPLVASFEDVAAEVLRPTLSVPSHPIKLARFGIAALQSATRFSRQFSTAQVRALFAGCAAHSFRPLTSSTTAAVGLMLVASGHRHGWPVAEGGSVSIARALASKLKSLGGTVVTGVEVRSLSDVPDARVKIFDVAPRAMADIAGEALPPRVRRAYYSYRRGPAAFKVDMAVEAGIPWQAEPARRAGTLHLGGSIEEIVSAEAEVNCGRMPERPFVLVGQQYLADPTRSVGNVHPVWAYAHVPYGFTGDATNEVISQIERFAPGVRDRIVAVTTQSPHQIEAKNANFTGGDISTGSNDPMQLLFRPRPAFDPYATGIPGVAICSAATPPGSGVHGMCGFHAVRSAMRTMRT